MTTVPRAILAVLVCSIASCASVSISQSFEVVAEFMMPDVARTAPQTNITLQHNFGTCSDKFLEQLADLRGRDYVDSVDTSVTVTRVQLVSDTTFSGIKAVDVVLTGGTESMSVCNRELTQDEQASTTIGCEISRRMRVEELCRIVDDVDSSANLAFGMTVQPSVMTMQSVQMLVGVDAEVQADVSL